MGGRDFLSNLLLRGLAARAAVNFRKKKLDKFVKKNCKSPGNMSRPSVRTRRNGPLEFAIVVATHLIDGQIIGR